MLFLDVLNAVLTLDVGYFAWLVVSNVFWIFTFAAVMVLFQRRKKHQLFYVFTMILLIYAIVDFMELLGWHIPPLMQIPTIVMFVGITAFDDFALIKKYGAKITLGGFWALIIFFNLVG